MKLQQQPHGSRHSSISYDIRAHHGMCLYYFEGKGYSGEFVRRMTAVKAALRENPVILLIGGSDILCACCPNNANNDTCVSGKAARYDRKVLERCGLEAGAVISWNAYEALVEDRILIPGKRQDICGDCEWNRICRDHSLSIQTSISPSPRLFQ